jgi:hypothetical protein
LKEGERGNKEEGFRLQKGERAGGLGKMPFFYLPPSQSKTGEAGWPSAGGGRQCPGGRRRPGKRGNRRGRQGDSIPLPDLGCDGVQGRLGGSGRRGVVPANGGGAREVKREREVLAKVRGEVGSRAGPFIGAGRSVRTRIFEL